MGKALERLFGTPHPVIGMVHLGPLPGSPRWKGPMARVLDAALRDARALKAGGVDGAILENYGDIPFLSGRVEASCVAAMAVALRACIEATGLPFGVNVLRNDPVSALAVAVAGGGRFIRTNLHTGSLLTDQGLLHGTAAEALRERARLGAGGVAVFADVLVKHAVTLGPRDPRRAARDAVERGLADGLLVTGPSTGTRPDFREVAAVRDEMPGVPVLVASGVAPRDMPLVAALADGVVAGTSLKRGGRTAGAVDTARVRVLVKAARQAWG